MLGSPGLTRWLCNPLHVVSILEIKAGGHFQPMEGERRKMKASSFYFKDATQFIQSALLLPPFWPWLGHKANMVAWESKRMYFQLVGQIPS